VWLALAVPLGWRDRPLETCTRLRGLAAAVAFLFLSGAMVIGLFYTTSNRYEVEFAPALVFLAVMGMLSLERWGARRPAVQRIVIRSAWIALLLFSIAVNLLASVDRAAVECYSLGRSLIQSGRPAEAVAKLEASLRIKAGYADAHNKLGIALSQLGRVPEAMAQFTEAVRLAPADVPPRLNLATALAVSGRATEATEQFRQVLQLDPANALAHLNFGILLAESGHRQDAIDQFSTGVRLKPDEADLRAALGTVLLSAGRTSEAVAELREALRLRPDDAAVRAALRQAGAWPEPAGPER
jgi:Flp pilus assembly protein TadD